MEEPVDQKNIRLSGLVVVQYFGLQIGYNGIPLSLFKLLKIPRGCFVREIVMTESYLYRYQFMLFVVI